MFEISRFVISLLTMSKEIFELRGSTSPSIARPGVVSCQVRTSLPFSSTPIQQYRMFADHLIEDVPNLGLLLLDQLFRLLDGGGQPLGVEPRVDERLEQLERHLLGQAALVQLELRTDDDHGAAGVIHPLAEQVL